MPDSEIKIYVVFSTSKNFFKKFLGKLIEWIDGVPFTHSSILIEDGYSQVMYESVIPKSQKIFIQDWSKHYGIEYIYRLPTTNLERAKFHLDQMVGIEYSIPQLILIAMARAFGNFQKYFGNNINGKKRLICSELVAEFLNKSFGYQFNESIDFVSLKDVWMAARELNKQRWQQ